MYSFAGFLQSKGREVVIGDKWTYAFELEGRTIELAEGESIIGRSRGCTVTLRDPSASRNHVLVTIKPGDVRARDLQSSNGTYLNGERLTAERPLHDGDRITIGETDIVMRITAPEMEEVGATVRLDAAKLQCPACSAELPVHAEFCARCGHRVGAGAAAEGSIGPAPPPPPASAAAVPPPPAVPPMAPPPLAPPPARTEIYGEVPAMPAPPAVAREGRSADADGELLPPIADDVFHTPGQGPASAARTAARGAAPPPPQRGATPTVPPRVAAAPAAAAAVAAAATLRPAGFWIRLLAQLVDGIWMMALVLVLTLPFGLRSETGLLVSAVFSTFLGLVVPLLCWGFFGATPGKALFGLRVVGGRRRRGLGLGLAFLRLCGMAVSAVLFGLGFLMIAFTRDKRGLHDHLAGTAVVRR